MPGRFDRLGRFFRDKLVGPKLGTYEESCDQLGGMPWRTFGQTEKWFLADPPEDRPPSLPEIPRVLDSGDFIIPRQSLFSFSTALWVLGGAAVAVIAVCGVMVAGRISSAAPVVTAAAPAETPAAAPVAPPSVAPLPPTARRAPDRIAANAFRGHGHAQASRPPKGGHRIAGRHHR
jgi:hypothetical protein